MAAWKATDPGGSGWGYGERLFQAARICTEMQYQHLVFEEFARKMQPLINPFLGGITNVNGVIPAEFAHTVYRLGHSMLPEIIARINVDRTTGAESNDDVRLREAFLNPEEFNSVGANNIGKTPTTAPEAVGAHRARHVAPDRQRARRVHHRLGAQHAGRPPARPRRRSTWPADAAKAFRR